MPFVGLDQWIPKPDPVWHIFLRARLPGPQTTRGELFQALTHLDDKLARSTSRQRLGAKRTLNGLLHRLEDLGLVRYVGRDLYDVAPAEVWDALEAADRMGSPTPL